MWDDVSNKGGLPVLQYLGHILAHPQWAHKAWAATLHWSSQTWLRMPRSP